MNDAILQTQYDNSTTPLWNTFWLACAGFQASSWKEADERWLFDFDKFSLLWRAASQCKFMSQQISCFVNVADDLQALLSLFAVQ